MSVMDMNSRMAMAEKLSVQQLQQAVQSGSLPAYIGIPLIEQKTKEKAQMAAAQQGQQKPPSVVASILQQADQQEQQERGIDELPSNLPMMEDEEVGMAGGGIVAFADRGQVEDPEQDPRIVALRQDPLYLDFVESGGTKEGDTSLEAFLRAGNAAPVTAGGPEYEPSRGPSPSRGRYDMNGPIGDFFDLFSNPPTGNAEAKQNPQAESGRPTPLGVSPEMLKRIRANKNPEEMEALSKEAKTFAEEIRSAPAPSIPAGAYNLTNPGATPPTLTDKALNLQSGETIGPQTLAAIPTPRSESLGSEFGVQGVIPNTNKNEGIDKLPAAKTAPPGTPGAPSSGRGALPSTLAAAERSDSPVADRATSMLDKYVAMLEKSGEDVGRQKKEALYMALIQGGLAAAGGMSPNALQNIAQGATLGAQNYQQAMRDIKKEDRARLEKLISAGLKKEEFLLKAEEIGVKRETARMVYDASMARTGALGGGGDDNKKNIAYNTATTSYNRTVGEIDKAIGKLQEDPLYKLGGKSPTKQGIQDRIDALERNKANAYKQYRGYVTDRLRIDIPDFSDPSGGGSKGLPMPKTKGELKTGETYNTAKGLAKWDGNQFVSGR